MTGRLDGKKSGTAMSGSKWKERALDRLGTLAECSFKSFKLIHRPPYRSFNSGATGIAYTFWKAACILDDPEWLHHARFWIDHVDATPEDDSIVEMPEQEGSTAEIQVEDSFYHGNRGVRFVQALIAYAQNDSRCFNNAVDKFVKPEKKRLEVQEMLQGIAGRLVGCAVLLNETGIEFFEEHGNALAGDLIGSARISGDGIPWGNNHRLGLAHGRAGNYYALLVWSKVSGRKLPDWVLDELVKYADSGTKQEHGISWPIDERYPDRYMNSWCNGAPGLLHLWSLAYRVYGEPVFLETARKTGEFCVHLEDYAFGHICCGAAGVSYGLLSLNSIDPDGPWLDHTTRYAEIAFGGKLITQYRLSLYTGSAGIACLMLDMERPESAEQPGMR